MKRLKSDKLYTRVYQEIRNYIVENDLTAGDKLPSEMEMCQTLGVSRNVVREALKSLQIMGIIQPSPSIGYVICSFSFDRIYENIFYHLLPNSSNLMIEMDYIRGALELFFLEEAMDSLNDDILERMKKALDGMEENLEMKKRITECDRIFHFALYENVKNSMFHSIERITWDLHPTLRVQDEEKYFDHIKRTLKIHKDFYNAVRKNDREKARKVLELHLHSSHDHIDSCGKNGIVVAASIERPSDAATSE